MRPRRPPRPPARPSPSSRSAACGSDDNERQQRRGRPPASRRCRRRAREDHHRLPGDPQRRPRRQAPGLAGEGAARHQDRVEAVRLGRLGQRGRRRAAASTSAWPAPAPSRAASRSRCPTRCRGSTTSSARPRRWSSRRTSPRSSDLKGKKIATPFASTVALLACSPRSRTPASTAKDVKIIDAEPDDIYAAWSRGDIDGAYVWNPNLAKLIEDGGNVLVTSAELAKKGKTTYDLAVVTNDFAEQVPRRRQDLGRPAGPGGQAVPVGSRRGRRPPSAPS